MIQLHVNVKSNIMETQLKGRMYNYVCFVKCLDVTWNINHCLPNYVKWLFMQLQLQCKVLKRWTATKLLLLLIFRCFPTNIDGPKDCQCLKLNFSSKHKKPYEDTFTTYGEYFLHTSFNGAPVYQHFSGRRYLFKDFYGTWFISMHIGLPNYIHKLVVSKEGDPCLYRRYS